MSTQYIQHLIKSDKDHLLIFDADNDNLKVRLIDYMAIWENAQLIDSITVHYDTLVDNTIIQQYHIKLLCNIKDVGKLLNYLRE